MKTVTNIQQLVQFCSAEESSKQNTPTVGGIGALRSSTYKKGKGGLRKQQQEGQQVQQPLPKCKWCGGKPHQGQSMEERHFESVCLNSKRGRTKRPLPLLSRVRLWRTGEDRASSTVSTCAASPPTDPPPRVLYRCRVLDPSYSFSCSSWLY